MTAVGDRLMLAGEDRTLLQAARRDRGWSQTQLIYVMRTAAARRGRELPEFTSMKTLVSSWENGHRMPGDFYVRLLCEVYGAEPIELGLFSTRMASPREVSAADVVGSVRAVYEARRIQLQRQAAEIGAELAYLEHVLSVPVPAGSAA